MTQFNLVVYGHAPDKRGQRVEIHRRKIEATSPAEYAKAISEVLPPATAFDSFAGLSITRVAAKVPVAVAKLDWSKQGK